MKKKHYILSIILFIALISGTYFFILKDYSLQEFISSVKNCNIEFIILSFLCMVFYSFFAALYNKRMLKHLNIKISWYQAFGYLFTEIFFSGITPSSIGGQPVEMMEMKKDGIDYQKNSIIILLNTILYKIATLLIATLGFTIYFNHILKQSKLFVYLFIFGYVSSVILVVFMLLLVYSKTLIPKILYFLVSVGSKIHIIKNKEAKIQKIDQAIKGYQDCARVTKNKPIILIESFTILLFQRLSLLSISYFVYRALGFNTLTIFELISFQACLTIACDFVPTPGGVAISEGLLSNINKFLYSSTLATSAVILLRGISFYLYVLFCGIFYVFFHFIKRHKAIDIKKSNN